MDTRAVSSDGLHAYSLEPFDQYGTARAASRWTEA
jgi:hypothetical protein